MLVDPGVCLVQEDPEPEVDPPSKKSTKKLTNFKTDFPAIFCFLGSSNLRKKAFKKNEVISNIVFCQIAIKTFKYNDFFRHYIIIALLFDVMG